MIEFTTHARRKIRQRNLREIWVIETLEKPDFTRASYKGREIAYKRRGKVHLKVVFVGEGDKIIVLTAHFEKGVRIPS